MHEVTRILEAIGQGDRRVGAELLPLVYEELRKLATEKMAQEKPDPWAYARAFLLRSLGGKDKDTGGRRFLLFFCATRAWFTH